MTANSIKTCANQNKSSFTLSANNVKKKGPLHCLQLRTQFRRQLEREKHKWAKSSMEYRSILRPSGPDGTPIRCKRAV